MIYLDSVFCIYAVESADDRGDAARALLAKHRQSTFAISSLVEMECLIHPFRKADLDLEDDYRAFFAMVNKVPLTPEVFERAARLRATTAVKTPDALHWAAARLGGCDELWTGDAAFAKAAAGFAHNVFSVI